MTYKLKRQLGVVGFDGRVRLIQKIPAFDDLNICKFVLGAVCTFAFSYDGKIYGENSENTETLLKTKLTPNFTGCGSNYSGQLLLKESSTHPVTEIENMKQFTRVSKPENSLDTLFFTKK